MKKQAVKFISWMMLVVFLIGVAPKEYLHELLYEHDDTVHPVYKKGEIAITDKHTHCSFLGFAFAPFIATEKQFISFKETSCYTNYLLPAYHYHYVSVSKLLSSRGPPINS